MSFAHCPVKCTSGAERPRKAFDEKPRIDYRLFLGASLLASADQNPFLVFRGRRVLYEPLIPSAVLSKVGFRPLLSIVWAWILKLRFVLGEFPVCEYADAPILFPT